MLSSNHSSINASAGSWESGKESAGLERWLSKNFKIGDECAIASGSHFCQNHRNSPQPGEWF
ncbi:hypothetical protein H6F61_25990 [Cyanobacteria bacterium FACHB-472]|nr:hypothetical protein [Cyanobacteria bacterium FACHB-472]